ncbi:DUF6153 family protein [Saccharothrix sp. ST-888]|uniref:DUF6153 family protein n=1 Tax=Saccharothrix sp. ST-888 TaxID=1427391 RepID=UPI000698893D|nr:DUF6153 family protein [Saccharothrix sp. ST-888]
MDTLTPRNQVTGSRWRAGVRALAVLALLLGLLGMHALADPGGGIMAHPEAHARHSAVSQQSTSQRSGAHRADPMPVNESAPMLGAGDGPCDCDGHHQAHAGSICQASGLGSAPVVPPLRPVLDTSFSGPVPSIADAPAQLTAGRGPPSLAALQLLRI